jgi:hypothetical protein
MNKAPLLLLSLFAALAPAGVSAVTFDVFSGASIQSAIDAASNGDIIDVHPGTYTGDLNYESKDISVIGVGGAGNTTLVGTGGSVVTLGGPAALAGFTVTGGNALAGAGANVSGTGSFITGNIFTGNQEGSGGYGAAIGGINASANVVGNIFFNNSSDDKYLSGTVSFIGNSAPVIANNLFLMNNGRGLNLTLQGGSSSVVSNNDFFQNTAAIRVDEDVDTTTEAFVNNILYNNVMGLEEDSATPSPSLLAWADNLVYGNAIDYGSGNGGLVVNYTGSLGNISANPDFVDPLDGNFALAPGSPAIDSGNPFDALSFDFFGTPRPDDGESAPDRGAIESIPEPSFYALVAASAALTVAACRRRQRRKDWDRSSAALAV